MTTRTIIIESIVHGVFSLACIINDAVTVEAVRSRYLQHLKQQLGKEVDAVEDIKFSLSPTRLQLVTTLTQCVDGQHIYPILFKKRGLWTSVAIDDNQSYVCKCGSDVSVTKLYIHADSTHFKNSLFYCLDCTPSDIWVSLQPCRKCARFTRPMIKTVTNNVCILECDDCDQLDCFVCEKPLSAQQQHEYGCKCGRIFYCSSACATYDRPQHQKECDKNFS